MGLIGNILQIPGAVVGGVEDVINAAIDDIF